MPLVENLNVEKEYREAMARLTPAERVARSVAMAKWARDAIARQIVAEKGPRSDERLKWEVALRVYRADPVACRTIEKQLANVPA